MFALVTGVQTCALPFFLIDGWQRGVPFGDNAEHVVRVTGREVSLHRGRLQGAVRGVGQDPLADAASLDSAPVIAGEMPSDGGLLFAALARASQICGALESVLGMSIRSEEHTSELQSLMRISYAVFCLKKKKSMIRFN